MKRVFVLGSLNMDMVISAPYVPRAGETLMGDGFLMNPGGKGANQAVACALQGSHTSLIGCVGDDLFGLRLRRVLKEKNVEDSYVRVLDGVPSGVAIIIVAQGDNRIILDAGANGEISLRDVESVIGSCAHEGDIFLAQLEMPIEIVEQAIKMAKQRGLYTILNPAPAVQISREIYQYIDLIIPNESEAELLTGIRPQSDKDILNIFNFFHQRGVKDMIVTLGQRGAVAVNADGLHSFDSIRVDVVDTTAAGDVFVGAVAHMLACSSSMDSTVKYAIAAASLTVTKWGAQQSIPSRDEVEKLIASVKQ